MAWVYIPALTLSLIHIFRFAGVGVAMENAVDAVKAEADYITGSNNHDGIVQVIEKFM